MPVYGSFQPAPLFPIVVAARDSGIVAVTIESTAATYGQSEGWIRDDSHPLIRAAREQIEGYFEGDLREFDLPLDPFGTPFYHRVWNALRRIPFGETRSYGDIAREVNSVARAVGQANGANPTAIVTPCHRVLQSDGSLGGYAAGLERKQYLLELERAVASGIRPRARTARV